MLDGTSKWIAFQVLVVGGIVLRSYKQNGAKIAAKTIRPQIQFKFPL